jgi:hypothetical protein
MNMTTNMAQRRPTTAPPITAATTFYINISIAVKFTYIQQMLYSRGSQP